MQIFRDQEFCIKIKKIDSTYVFLSLAYTYLNDGSYVNNLFCNSKVIINNSITYFC